MLNKYFNSSFTTIFLSPLLTLAVITAARASEPTYRLLEPCQKLLVGHSQIAPNPITREPKTSRRRVRELALTYIKKINRLSAQDPDFENTLAVFTDALLEINHPYAELLKIYQRINELKKQMGFVEYHPKLSQLVNEAKSLANRLKLAEWLPPLTRQGLVKITLSEDGRFNGVKFNDREKFLAYIKAGGKEEYKRFHMARVEIDFAHNFLPEDFAELADWPNLREIIVHGYIDSEFYINSVFNNAAATLEKIIIQTGDLNSNTLRILGQLPRLNYLELSNISNIAPELIHLARSQSLVTLIINHININTPIGEKLMQIPSLSQVSFANCSISNRLAQTLIANPRLQTLDLSHNELNNTAVINLPQNTTLKKLNLNRNHLDNIGAQRCWLNQSLQHLNLADNRITDPSGLKHLEHNHSLQEIDLAHNLLHIAGAQLLAQKLGARQLSAPPLVQLNLNYCQIQDAGAVALKNLSINALDITANEIAQSANIIALLAMPELTRLAFGNNLFPNELFKIKNYLDASTVAHDYNQFRGRAKKLE